MRRIIGFLLGMLLSTSAVAQSQNNVLAQLGVKGVTDKIYGTNAALYANYLIKTYTNGLIDISLMSTEVAPHKWYKTAFVDSINGLDSTNAGTAVCPYKTFAYAATRITNDTAFVLTPGTYVATTITNANAHHVALIGLDFTNTVMTGILNFNASLPAGTMDISVYLSGVTVQDIRQYQYGTLTVEAYNRAKVTGNITRLYTTANSYGTLFADPSASIANVISGANSTNYVKAYIPAGTAAGQLAYWNGTNWLTAAVGATNQMLFGGSAPYWSYPNFVYTNLPGDFLPAVSNVYSLGSQAYPWSNGWFGTAIYVNGTNVLNQFTNETLQTVTTRGATTGVGLTLNGNHNVLGTNTPAATDSTSAGNFSQSIGYNAGYRWSVGRGSINIGDVEDGLSAQEASAGGVNIGYLLNGGYQDQEPTTQGGVNIGYLDNGLQVVKSGGSMNVGYLNTFTEQWSSGPGCFNFGYATDYFSGQRHQAGYGNIAVGSLHNAGYQHTDTGCEGCGLFGYLDGGKQYTAPGTKGAFILGGAGTNTHDYAITLGAGLHSMETNSVHARKFFENGVSLEGKYVSNGWIYVEWVGNASTLYVVSPNGQYTNKIGTFSP